MLFNWKNYIDINDPSNYNKNKLKISFVNNNLLLY
jgi:hypothetical protein